MAKRNLDTESKLASLKAELERLRNENHNLKRKVKRMEERKIQAESDRRTEEVTNESIEDIKKKLQNAGMDSKAAEVMTWAMFGDTDSKKR